MGQQQEQATNFIVSYIDWLIDDWMKTAGAGPTEEEYCKGLSEEEQAEYRSRKRGRHV